MDPITFALILGAAFWVADTTSSGLLRAEVGGGLAGAFGASGRRWFDRRKANHVKRTRIRSKSKAGRALNAVIDETLDLGGGFVRGWPEGRRRARAKRAERLATTPSWWARLFGESIAYRLEDEPEDEAEAPKGSEPEPERDVWQDPEPIRTSGSKSDPGGPSSTPRATSKTPKGQPEQTPNGVPNGTTEGTTRGTETVADLNSAQAVIAAWEEIKNRIEQVKADLKQISGDASGLADGAGAFKVGTEDDGVKALDNAVAWLGAAEERIDVVVASIHDDFDASIEASEGKKAEVHSAFQGG